MAATGISLDAITPAVLSLGVVGLTIWALAHPVAEGLLRWRARRLPEHLSERFDEEWLSELALIPSRSRKLLFAVSIAFTRTTTFADAEAQGLADLAGQVVISVEDVRAYSEFWQRLAALAVDTFVFIAFGMILTRLVSPDQALPATLLGLAYNLGWLVAVQTVMTARCGGTPGKLLVKLRVVRMDGGPMRLHDAVVRAAPDYVLFVAMMVITGIALTAIDLAAFNAAELTERQALLLSVAPAWLWRSLDVARTLWVAGDLLTYYHSYEGRALHDVIAGTVVVMKVPHVVAPKNLIEPPIHRTLTGG